MCPKQRGQRRYRQLAPHPKHAKARHFFLCKPASQLVQVWSSEFCDHHCHPCWWWLHMTKLTLSPSHWGPFHNKTSPSRIQRTWWWFQVSTTGTLPVKAMCHNKKHMSFLKHAFHTTSAAWMYFVHPPRAIAVWRCKRGVSARMASLVWPKVGIPNEQAFVEGKLTNSVM